jgi:predicted ATP-binding protein involved in virulence
MSKAPTVFISYSHDSQEHMDRVLALSNRLRRDGIDCNIDQYQESPVEGWPHWISEQINNADFVLVVVTKSYYSRFHGTSNIGGKGVTWESTIITELYENARNTKFIPVVFTVGDTSNIPELLKGVTTYQLESKDGYEALYRRITSQSSGRPALGSLRKLPPVYSQSKENKFRIDKLEIKNFKKLSHYILELHPQLTLLVGDNGTGKTTILDALAIAAGVWLVNAPDTALSNSKRNILPHEIHLDAVATDDSFRMVEDKPVVISTIGIIGSSEIGWTRQISRSGSRTSNIESKQALKIIDELFDQEKSGERSWFPIIAYYGAGRAWLPSNKLNVKPTNEPSRRWDAFYDCLQERIRIGDLQNWFHKEVIAALHRNGVMRTAYQVVKFAILKCIPDASNLWFDSDRLELMLMIDSQPQPFNTLSAGQKMMVALVADIAIKIVTQNVHFLSEEPRIDGQTLPRVLQKTSGLVLIDELDVHLHPKWQRQVVNDLKTTFPSIQFVCTSHSPFIIQSISQGELRSLDVEDSRSLEYENHSIEDIAEDIQLVEVPQQSQKAHQFAQAAEKYFELLQDQDETSPDELAAAEVAYRQSAEPFAADPGLNALLKLDAMAKAKEKAE